MNNDLISRSALKNEIDTWGCNDYDKYDFLEAIDNAPTVYPICEDKVCKYRANERPQGEWIDYSEEGFVECPFCHKATTCEDNIDELHYCWNCGAKLGKGGAE